MTLRITVEGKFNSVWKPIKTWDLPWPEVVNAPDELPFSEEFKQRFKGLFGITVTAIERVRVEIV